MLWSLSTVLPPAHRVPQKGHTMCHSYMPSTGWKPTEHSIFDDSWRPYVRYRLILRTTKS